jgi:hypothetical protein
MMTIERSLYQSGGACRSFVSRAHFVKRGRLKAGKLMQIMLEGFIAWKAEGTYRSQESCGIGPGLRGKTRQRIQVFFSLHLSIQKNLIS